MPKASMPGLDYVRCRKQVCLAWNVFLCRKQVRLAGNVLDAECKCSWPEMCSMPDASVPGLKCVRCIMQVCLAWSVLGEEYNCA